MFTKNQKSLKYRIFIWSAFALCLLGIWYLLSILNPIVIRYGDSVQYWAAGRLMIFDGNPYSAELVETLRQQAGIFLDLPPDATSMMLYPPWTLPFLIPFGFLDYTLSRLLWFVFHLVIIFFSARFIWHLYQGPKQYYWVAFLVAFTFTPSLYVLLMGHITTLSLIRYPGFSISSMEKSSSEVVVRLRCWRLRGVGYHQASICCYLFMLALLLWVIEESSIGRFL